MIRLCDMFIYDNKFMIIDFDTGTFISVSSTGGTMGLSNICMNVYKLYRIHKLPKQKKIFVDFFGGKILKTSTLILIKMIFYGDCA